MERLLRLVREIDSRDIAEEAIDFRKKKKDLKLLFDWFKTTKEETGTLAFIVVEFESTNAYVVCLYRLMFHVRKFRKWVSNDRCFEEFPLGFYGL